MPDGVGSQTGTTTAQFTPLGNDSCDWDSPGIHSMLGQPDRASACITGRAGPSSVPPLGVTWTLFDTDGNQLWTTTGVYEPGSSSAAYARTTYQLFKGNTLTGMWIHYDGARCSRNTWPPYYPCGTP